MATSRILLGFLSLAVVAHAADKTPYMVKGVYTETCACHAPCTCELTGEVPSYCQGVGAFKVTSGSFGGSDLSGVGIAYATKPGEWVRLYVDAPDTARRAAAEKFGRAAFAAFGPIEMVKDSKVDIQGSMGAYTVVVDGGKTMNYTIEPVLGGDGKTPVGYTNTHGVLTTKPQQAKSTKATVFHDDTRTFEIEAGHNGYFNDKMDTKGSL